MSGVALEAQALRLQMGPYPKPPKADSKAHNDWQEVTLQDQVQERPSAVVTMQKSEDLGMWRHSQGG